ncbi:MAG: hypothetical protein GDA49_04295 [Rhodospirillales bacterium]|nr:hypothetical protein [Rhodospirillales bacterium]
MAEVVPVRIVFLDQGGFPVSSPPFDPLFAHYGIVDFPVLLNEDKALYTEAR